RIDRREGRTPRHPTRALRLAGANGLAESREPLDARGAALRMDPDTLAHLRRAYGADALALLDLVEAEPALAQRLAPELPYIAAEVVWASRSELALTVEDVLARRTHLAIEDRSRGADAAEAVAALMARELGWSEAERQGQIDAYRRFAREQSGPLAETTGEEDEARQRQQELAPQA
ncbi:MAG: glycerol-3-phosphate dehydrogenase C-terminal domain-containing protein, partial [Ktedonobacterales bacterium]